MGEHSEAPCISLQTLAILGQNWPVSLTQEGSNWSGVLTVDLLYQQLLYIEN